MKTGITAIHRILVLTLACAHWCSSGIASAGDPYAAWSEAMLAARLELAAATGSNKPKTLTQTKARLEQAFTIEWDWLLQDAGEKLDLLLSNSAVPGALPQAIRKALAELGNDDQPWRRQYTQLCESVASGNESSWLRLYAQVCEQRRHRRLATLLETCPQLIFTRHYNLGGSHYAYTEGQSDAQNERNFVPGSSLCLLKLNNGRPEMQVLLEDPHGVIRDPDVSWDGKRILFAWKKSDLQDDYHLYEMEVATRNVRQLTFGLGFADYEGAYLPNGDLIFTSTRCVQTVDCWWTEVSNLYSCNPDGKFLRRLTFDQVHDNFPTVLPDGRIIYTRWEYSDRGQIYVQGLFQMNPDGTGQMEFYGNNSWFPTTLLHSRGIPGSEKVLSIFSGHHTLQAGKLGILTPSRGRQENSGAQLAAPYRNTPAVRVDAFGQSGELFQHPYPLDEHQCVVAYAPSGWARQGGRFGIYWMNLDGRRELLFADSKISCNQPIPLRPRPIPHHRPSQVDYASTNGSYYVQDIYAGEGLVGVPRGTVQRLRVVGIEYRAAGIGHNYNQGPAGAALSSTPVSIGNGCWDPKVVLGEAKIYPDGSAYFQVPARTPVYFQALDTNGHAVQSMRSWSTLQPGEIFSCTGCHESKSAAPPPTRPLTLALQNGPQQLEPFYGPARGFSFPKEIQPLLDRHCISCHNDPNMPRVFKGTSSAQSSASHGAAVEPSFSLLSRTTVENLSKRAWSDSYLALTQAKLLKMGETPYLAGTCTPFINWIDSQSVPPMLPPYSKGAAKSGFLAWLKQGHHHVKLSREDLDKLACWIDLGVPYCGDYTEANAWSEREVILYQHFLAKRQRMEAVERENLNALRSNPR